MVLVNFSIVSQKGKKMHSKKVKSNMANGYAKLVLLLTCQVHKAHIGKARENSSEKNLCGSGAPSEGWINSTHFCM